MVIVNVESSLESSGRGGGGGRREGREGSSVDSSSGSSSPPTGTPPAVEAQSLVADVGRIFHGDPLFLLRGGVRIDLVPLVPL